jgi:replicative DNA helicase
VDLDIAFVSALLSEGTDGWRVAIEKGIRADDLSGNGRLAFDYISEHLQSYGSLPVLAVVEGRLGLELGAPQGQTIYFADEINNRKLHGAIQTGVTRILTTLRDAKPQDAYSEIENLLSTLRREQVVGSRVKPWSAIVRDTWAFYERLKAGETGVLTPWSTINEATLGFWPQDLVVVVARQGVGKCVHEDTEIVDPRTGVPRKIRDFYADESCTSVTTWSSTQGVLVGSVSAKIDTGRKECLKFTLGTGRSVTVTPEHPFLTPEGWVRADELRAGRSVGLPARMPMPQEAVRLRDSEVDLLALLLSEGSYTGNHVGFSTADAEVLRIAEAAAVDLGLSVVHRRKYDYDLVSADGSTIARHFLERFDLGQTLAKEKTIPEAVWRLPADQLARFLGLFWMCDGYVDNGPGITLASEALVRQLQSLLLRFGCQSSVHYKEATCEGKTFDAWRLRVYSHCLEAFALIPLFGTKGERIAALLEKDRNPNVGNPVVSEAFWQRVGEIAVARKGGLRDTGLRLGWTTPFVLRSLHGANGTVNLRVFREFCAVFACATEFEYLLGKDVFWDSVTQVASVGPCRIYDLTVPETSCFVANDVIVHNTWFAIITALHAWMNGKKVLFATTEVAQVAVSMRLLALYNRVAFGNFRHGRLDMFTEQRVLKSIDDLEGSHGLWVIGGDFDFRTESLEAAMEEVEPDLTIADGAYLMDTADGGSTRTEKAASAFNELKRMAKRRNSVVLATTQFNRSASSDKASSIKLENVGLTDVVGWNADLAFGMIQTEDMRTDKKMMIKPLKVREGIGKDLTVEWDMETMDFREILTATPDADEFSTGVTIPPSGAADPSTDAGAGSLF